MKILDAFGNPDVFPHFFENGDSQVFQLQNRPGRTGAQVVAVSDELKILVAGLTLMGSRS